MSKNSVFYVQSKHFNIRYHFIRGCMIQNEVQLKFVKSRDQIMNIFTKFVKFEDFRNLSMILRITNQV